MRFALLKTMVVSVFSLMLSYSAAQQNTARNTPVLFICEHGNVKSLMAASYFNQMANKRGLPFHAVARGTHPNSTTVPPGVVDTLRAEGVDVSSFHPSMLSNSDLSTSARVIAIGVELTPDSRQLAQTSVEEWNDIPPATLSYAATQQALKAHVERLVDELSKATASPRSSSAGK
jgi:arsenate reductase